MVFRIVANRSSASVFGAASAYLKRDGKVLEFETAEEAQKAAWAAQARLMSQNVWYTVEASHWD